MDGARIQQLIHAAAQARQGGRVDDAGRLLRQAELEAPRHPQVLNEVAGERLTAGDSLGAYQVLTEAVKAEPSNPSLWLNLAAALRGLDRLDEEMAALQRVLAIEPRNLRALLQKASLLELQNKPRAAAAAYRTALQSLAPGTRTPPWMEQVLVHARDGRRCEQSNARGIPRGAVDEPYERATPISRCADSTGASQRWCRRSGFTGSSLRSCTSPTCRSSSSTSAAIFPGSTRSRPRPAIFVRSL